MADDHCEWHADEMTCEDADNGDGDDHDDDHADEDHECENALKVVLHM